MSRLTPRLTPRLMRVVLVVLLVLVLLKEDWGPLMITSFLKSTSTTTQPPPT